MSDDTDDREFIRNTLTEWKLSKWYNRFIEEDIDKEAFLSITETEVSRIITTIGGIRCFLEKRKLLMDGIKLVNIDDPLVHNTCDAGESSLTNKFDRLVHNNKEVEGESSSLFSYMRSLDEFSLCR
ncbi:uncharacterized protein LOC143898177 [Temnothorax americanus]|uniref:uncharacterized protein LOC143898177 n=1 Tax=Temnothorax americanus TaxID=1964332 RepID=UPI004067B8DA